MLVFEWLTVQPVDFFNVLVHTNLVFVCLALCLFVSIITCARERKKDAARSTTNESHPSQPVSNSDATSKKTNRLLHTSNSSSTTPGKDNPKKALVLPAQPVSGPSKEAAGDEEKGVRKKHKKEDRKEEDKGSIRISIHGAAASSSDGPDDEIYMQDVFDDVTARDDMFPGESQEARNKKRKQRKKKTTSTLNPTQSAESDRVDPTQGTSDQQSTTAVESNDATKEQNCTQTGHTITQDQTRDTTLEQTRDTTKGDATMSDRPAARNKLKLRQAGSKHKIGDFQRKKKSSFKYDPSKTGESNTESTKKRIPKNRKKVSACAQKTKGSNRVGDAPSFTQKDSARS